MTNPLTRCPLRLRPPQPVAFFDSAEPAQLTSRLAADCSVISRVMSTSINVALRNLLQVGRGAAAAGGPASVASSASAPQLGFGAGACGHAAWDGGQGSGAGACGHPVRRWWLAARTCLRCRRR